MKKELLEKIQAHCEKCGYLFLTKNADTYSIVCLLGIAQMTCHFELVRKDEDNWTLYDQSSGWAIGGTSEDLEEFIRFLDHQVEWYRKGAMAAHKEANEESDEGNGEEEA